MAEFKFSCPQCKQHIQCDSIYAGSQINCPSCQQLIVVPSVPPSIVAPAEGAIQIKTATLKKIGIIAVCVLAAIALVGLPTYFFTGSKSVIFKAFVDGTETIKLRGGKMWIEHQDWKLPNKITVNSKPWNPAWNDKTSAPYDLRKSFHPSNAANIKLIKNVGRGDIVVTELPSAANQQTLSIKIDDGNFGGAAWYEFTLSW